ncbi:hypothetical protein [Paraferrimonas sedimenticola]|uniref:Uncharacterized protein n=1 Tax=Paraferrimonas sedimenticola TaxID=375674 RepID=A0AA37W0N1_9GAMM|nr:hypothetical protein [Paraferrimonas sedimenticola]GLP95247.1 hypothetical protein GCM10007895_05530 [Paraferrimonas sedimenticola]
MKTYANMKLLTPIILGITLAGCSDSSDESPDVGASFTNPEMQACLESSLLHHTSIEDIYSFDCGVLENPLELNQLPNLKSVYISHGTHSSDALDLSGLTTITRFSLRNYTLDKLILGDNPALEYLSVVHLESEDIDSRLKNLDLSGATAIDDFHLRGTTIETLDLKYNPEVRSMTIWDSALSTLSLSQATELERITIYESQLTSLDTSVASNLESVAVSRSPLALVDPSNNIYLTHFQVNDGQIESVRFDNHPSLIWVDLRGNPLDEATKSHLDSLGIEARY